MAIDATQTNMDASNLVDLIEEGLRLGRADALRGLFNANGARAPLVIWSPNTEEFHSPLLRHFAETCDRMMGPDGRVSEPDFDLEMFGALKGWLMLVEPAGDQYRYIHYGKNIIDHYGRDMTGKTTEGFGGHISQFFIALYRAAAQRQERVLSEHEPPIRIFVRLWRRLIVPIFDEHRTEVIRFAVMNVPENELRAGLELMVDPVFVLSADHRVHYCNRAAEGMFNLAPIRRPDALLQDLTGIRVDIAQSPDHMLSHQTVDDSIQLTLRGGIAERLLMTVSAAEYRGSAYYIVVMRLVGT